MQDRRGAVLERKLARVLAAQQAERKRQEQRLATMTRAADRRLGTMVRAVAALRHHEARAAALERMLAEREATLAAQVQRIRQLEAAMGESSPSGGEEGLPPRTVG